MNKSARKFALLVLVLATVAGMAFTSRMAFAQSKTTVVWFVGLGSGTNDQQIAVQKEVVADFNKSQDKIDLQIQIAANFGVGMDTITTLIAAGNPPDIVGPVGVGGSNALADQWMDLKPLIDKNKVDLSKFDPAVLGLYQTLNGGYSAIPFGVFPSVVYYNLALFDEAGLKYPPSKVGDKYTMPDGSQVDWNYDTIAKVARLLTVDKNGEDATSAKFDAQNIVQYGLNFQYAALRLMLTDLQPSKYYDPATDTVKIPDEWKKGIQWLYDGLWGKQPFISSATAEASTLLNAPNAFGSGHLGMAITPLWFTCCLHDVAKTLKFNFGVMPASFDGKVHDAVDADTFRIIKGSKNPDAAFTVLQYILGPAVAKLSPVYGAFPARPEFQKSWLDSQNEIYAMQKVDWQVAIDMLKYTNPADLHHEANVPHYQQAVDRLQSFGTLLFNTSGAQMDVNAEIAKLQSDLQSVVKGTFPTSTPVPTPTPAPTKAS